MHRGHDHDHHHHHGNGAAGAGHNHARPVQRAAQWQTPHLPDQEHDHQHGEPDLDLVEAAFVEGFTAASDPTSFLRLAQIPFETTDDAKKLVLLRVETEAAIDIGAVMPHVGGETFRYDPLPAALVSRRRSLRFIYFDGAKVCPLSLAQVRELSGLGTGAG